MEYLNDTVKTVHDMLKLEVEKYKKLERKVSALRSHLQQFKELLRQHDPSSTPPLLLPLYSVNNLEKMRTSAHLMESWINKSFKKANAFVKELVRIFDKVSSVLERTQILMAAYDVFTFTKDHTMPRLQAMKNFPKQTLVNGGVLEDG